jgi:hypothetical protein
MVVDGNDKSKDHRLKKKLLTHSILITNNTSFVLNKSFGQGKASWSTPMALV